MPLATGGGGASDDVEEQGSEASHKEEQFLHHEQLDSGAAQSRVDKVLDDQLLDIFGDNDNNLMTVSYSHATKLPDIPHTSDEEKEVLAACLQAFQGAALSVKNIWETLGERKCESLGTFESSHISDMFKCIHYPRMLQVFLHDHLFQSNSPELLYVAKVALAKIIDKVVKLVRSSSTERVARTIYVPEIMDENLRNVLVTQLFRYQAIRIRDFSSLFLCSTVLEYHPHGPKIEEYASSDVATVVHYVKNQVESVRARKDIFLSRHLVHHIVDEMEQFKLFRTSMFRKSEYAEYKKKLTSATPHLELSIAGAKYKIHIVDDDMCVFLDSPLQKPSLTDRGACERYIADILRACTREANVYHSRLYVGSDLREKYNDVFKKVNTFLGYLRRSGAHVLYRLSLLTSPEQRGLNVMDLFRVDEHPIDFLVYKVHAHTGVDWLREFLDQEYTVELTVIEKKHFSSIMTSDYSTMVARAVALMLRNVDTALGALQEPHPGIVSRFHEVHVFIRRYFESLQRMTTYVRGTLDVEDPMTNAYTWTLLQVVLRKTLHHLAAMDFTCRECKEYVFMFLTQSDWGRFCIPQSLHGSVKDIGMLSQDHLRNLWDCIPCQYGRLFPQFVRLTEDLSIPALSVQHALTLNHASFLENQLTAWSHLASLRQRVQYMSWEWACTLVVAAKLAGISITTTQPPGNKFQMFSINGQNILSYAPDDRGRVANDPLFLDIVEPRLRDLLKKEKSLIHSVRDKLSNKYIQLHDLSRDEDVERLKGDKTIKTKAATLVNDMLNVHRHHCIDPFIFIPIPDTLSNLDMGPDPRSSSQGYLPSDMTEALPPQRPPPDWSTGLLVAMFISTIGYMVSG
jgi:hypothetical protein